MVNEMEKMNNQPPKPEEPEEGMTFEEFYQDLKKDIIDALLKIYERDEENLAEGEKEAFDKYGTYLANAMVSSIEAGEYFKGLIPGSMRKPEKQYESTGQMPPLVAFEYEKLELAKKQDKVAEFTNMSEDFQSEVNEEEKDGNVEQLSYNRFWKGEQRIVTEELVRNFLKEGFNVPFSNLVVTDWKTGVRMDLGHLLPEGHMLSPSKLLDYKREYDEEKQDFVSKFTSVNLEEYQGTKGSDSPFYHSLNFKNVYYGDIIKKGGTLALFHEIAHAWQQVYQGKYEKGDFDDFHLDSVVLLGMLEEAQEKLKSGEVTQEKFNKREAFILDTLRKKGVEVDTNNFIFNGQDFKEGTIILKKYNGKKYAIQCESFPEILRAYERCERDAWAHAMLMLKFLRKRGIDLEPEMKSLADIKEYVEPCLDSYQKSAEQKVEIVGGKVAFVKRK